MKTVPGRGRGGGGGLTNSGQKQMLLYRVLLDLCRLLQCDLDSPTRAQTTGKAFVSSVNNSASQLYIADKLMIMQLLGLADQALHFALGFDSSSEVECYERSAIPSPRMTPYTKTHSAHHFCQLIIRVSGADTCMRRSAAYMCDSTA